MQENLFEISHRLRLILDLIIQNDGLIDDDIKGLLDEYSEKFDFKINSYVHLIKLHIESEIAKMKKIEELAYTKRKSLDRTSKQLKTYILEMMKHNDIRKVKGDLYTVYIRKGIKSLDITDAKAIDEKYKKTITRFEINRSKLLFDLKGGDTVEGASLKQGGDTISFNTSRKNKKEKTN